MLTCCALHQALFSKDQGPDPHYFSFPVELFSKNFLGVSIEIYFIFKYILIIAYLPYII